MAGLRYKNLKMSYAKLIIILMVLVAIISGCGINEGGVRQEKSETQGQDNYESNANDTIGDLSSLDGALEELELID